MYPRNLSLTQNLENGNIGEFSETSIPSGGLFRFLIRETQTGSGNGKSHLDGNKSRIGKRS